MCCLRVIRVSFSCVSRRSGVLFESSSSVIGAFFARYSCFIFMLFAS